MISGIYTITNTVNGKMYVGCAKNVKRRWRQHKDRLGNRNHHSQHLQRSWNEYGKEVFIFELLVECAIEDLFSEEHYWCNMLNVHDHSYGYNIRPTHPYDKYSMSKASLKKMAETKRGGKLSTESIRKRTETRQKKAEERGYYYSEETNKKRANALRGKTRSQEAINNWRESRKGWTWSAEQREQIRQQKTGGKLSEETKRKISEKHKGRSADHAKIKVKQEHKITGEIKIWNSVEEAMKQYNITRKVWSNLLKGMHTYRFEKGNPEIVQYKWSRLPTQ